MMTVPRIRAWAFLVFGLTFGSAAAVPQGLILPLVDIYTYAEDKGALFGHHAKNVQHVATKEFAEQEIVPLGVWAQADNDTQRWQWEIHSPGAQSHLLVFSEVYLPDSGVLELCPADQALGQCERYTPLSIPSSRQLVVPIIPGDRVRLQYIQQDTEQIPRLRLAAIMQGLRESLAQARLRLQSARRRLQAAASAPMSAPGPGLGSGSAGPAGQPRTIAALGPTPPQQAQGTQFDIDSMQVTSDDVSECTPSVECSSWHDEAAAVVAIYAIDMRLGAMGLCTGTVVNAPQGRKYLLTADHCFIDKQDISNFQWWILIFNYQMPCRSTATPGPLREVIQGTKLVFYDSKADVLLLDIPESIPDHFHAYKVGFDAAEDSPARAVAIHQPHGNIKRISYANDSSDIKTQFSAPVFSEDIHPTQATHYQVQWTQGATEPGSSGAALIDADTRKVVGVLTGGTTTCSIFSGADYFGKLSVAWNNGLQNFLSDAPGLKDSSAALNSITQLDDGIVIVDSLGGSPVRTHGPAMNFFPTVFVLGPTDVTRVAFYLTDPPRANETIMARMSLVGDLPGNSFNPVKNVTLSTKTFNFTTENCCTKAQPLVVSTQMGNSVPGDLVRLQVVFWLTSNTNSSYLHVSTVKGVVQSNYQPWATLQPVACLTAPCNFRHPILASAPPTYPLPTRAVFQYAPSKDTAVGQDICLQAGVLELSTVSVYINGTFTWTLSESYDQPDCVHIPALDVPAGIAMNTVVSDSDDYDAVLPLSVVKSINIYEGTKKVYSSTRGNAAAALVAAATQEGLAPVGSAALPPAASSGAAAVAQPALSAPAVSTAAAPSMMPAQAVSAGGSIDSDAAGTGIGVSGPADSSQGASGSRSGQGAGGAGQVGQQGQGGQSGVNSAAGGFVAGTGIGAAGPDSVVSASSLQAPPPAPQELGQGPSQGSPLAASVSKASPGVASSNRVINDTTPYVVILPTPPLKG